MPALEEGSGGNSDCHVETMAHILANFHQLKINRGGEPDQTKESTNSLEDESDGWKGGAKKGGMRT
jgi:hypothetical protein